MALTLPAFRRFPHLVKFKSGSNNPGLIAAMTSTGTGIILFLPTTVGGATGASGPTATQLQSLSLFDFITIDPAQVDDYTGTITMTADGVGVT